MSFGAFIYSDERQTLTLSKVVYNSLHAHLRDELHQLKRMMCWPANERLQAITETFVFLQLHRARCSQALHFLNCVTVDSRNLLSFLSISSALLLHLFGALAVPVYFTVTGIMNTCENLRSPHFVFCQVLPYLAVVVPFMLHGSELVYYKSKGF